AADYVELAGASYYIRIPVPYHCCFRRTSDMASYLHVYIFMISVAELQKLQGNWK
ncbi:hypothetical protein AKJ16_DCAP10063, partial [Drosera capensis]